jgi:hypothetical protein
MINKLKKEIKIGRDRFMFSSSFIYLRCSTICDFTDANILISFSKVTVKSITELTKRYIYLHSGYIHFPAGYYIKKQFKNILKSLILPLQYRIISL